MQVRQEARRASASGCLFKSANKQEPEGDYRHRLFPPFRRFRWGSRLAESQLMYQPAGSPFAWAAESKMMYRLPPSSHFKKESPVAEGLYRLPVKGSSPMVTH